MSALLVNLFILVACEILFTFRVLSNGFFDSIGEYGEIFSIAFTYILLLLAGFSLNRVSFLKKDEEIPKVVWLTFSLFLLIFQAMHSIIVILNFEFNAYLVLMAVIFITFLLTMYLLEKFSIAYEQQFESTLHAQEKEHYHVQYQLMQKNIEITRAMKHDLNLHLNSLHEQLQISPEQAQDYLNKLLDENKTHTIYSNTGNIAFDSIINNKLCAFTKSDAILDIDIKVPTELDMESTDVTIILGNLLNNAIDASTVVENPFIRLDINYQNGRLLLTIENTFDGVVNYKGDQIISRYDERKRGFGLKNIRKAVERYNGEMSVDYTDESFIVEILLFV